MPRTPVTSTTVERITPAERKRARDLIAVEEPLQIILEHGEGHARTEAPLAMTMRTPGRDRDLVVGFLYSEGVIACRDDLIAVRHCSHATTPENVIRASLHERVVVPRRLLERSLTVTSACGVCGERTLEALSNAGCRAVRAKETVFAPEAVGRALRSLERSQACFRHTGGTHGAALFDLDGKLLVHREDVGRHNALDKLVGAWLDHDGMPSESCFVVVSSRASFELLQKTVRAGFPMIVAIGAPSSLAVETALRFGVTLVGFARPGRFNVYSSFERILPEADEPTFYEVGAAE